jgi:hypothetical protein
MINNGRIRDQVLELIGKDQYSGQLSARVFERAFNDFIQIDLLNDYIRQFEASREISMDLFPFIKTLGDGQNPLLTVSDPFGVCGYADKPEDMYYYARGERYKIIQSCAGISIDPMKVIWMDQAEFGDRITNELMRPGVHEYIATVQNGRIAVSPYVNELSITYIRAPRQIVFDYDIIGGQQVYLPPGQTHVNGSVQAQGSPSLSIDHEWPDTAVPEIIRRFVAYHGRSRKDNDDSSIQAELKKPEQ